jgi:hypothetical protein
MTFDVQNMKWAGNEVELEQFNDIGDFQNGTRGYIIISLLVFMDYKIRLKNIQRVLTKKLKVFVSVSQSILILDQK